MVGIRRARCVRCRPGRIPSWPAQSYPGKSGMKKGFTVYALALCALAASSAGAWWAQSAPEDPSPWSSRTTCSPAPQTV